MAIALAAGVMAAAISVPVLAAEGTTYTGTKIVGTYSSEGAPVETVSVAVSAAETMHFEYRTGTPKQWDPNTHTYLSTAAETGGTWVPTDNNQITVINHSNIPVKASFNWTANEGYEGIKVGTSKNGFVLASAENTTVANAPKETVTVGMTNDSTLASGKTDVEMGTLTLEISRV